jgi:hypothetical protein
MSEAELWELILISQGNMGAKLAVYISVVSGYLIVAYLIGQKLNTVQCATVTILFAVTGLMLTTASYAFLSRGAFLMQFTDTTYRSPASAVIPFAPAILSLILILGLGASLKFMWDIRHPKTE